MQRFESVDLGRLMWKQTRFGARDFELWSGDDLVGVLYWPKLLSQRAVAECANGRWAIDRVGFFRRRTVVTELGSSVEIASFEAGWLGDGDLILPNGHAYHWYRTGCLGNGWALADKEDNIVFEIQAGMRWFKHEADVISHVRAESCPELPLLIHVGWYIAYMMMQDAAAIVAATAAC